MKTVMKMASLLTITFLLCCSVIASKGSLDNCGIYAEIGGNVIVPLNQQWGPLEILKWKLQSKVIFHKYGGRVITGKSDDITANGSLSLQNLKKEDSGEYIPEVYDEDRRLKSASHVHLCVLDPVEKPKVETECTGEKVNFTCIVDQQGASHQWYQNDTLLEKEKGLSLIKVAKDVQSDSFFCKVSNKISSENSNKVFISSIEKCLASIIPNTLKVSPKALPPAVPEGGDITLSCNVTREPTHPTYLSVTWLVKKGTTSEEILTFSPSGGATTGTNFTRRYEEGSIQLAPGRNGLFELVISKVMLSDEGTYECNGKEWMHESGGKKVKIRESTKEFGTVTITPAGFPKELFGISIWVFIGGGGGIVLVLIIITVCCIRARRKKRRQPKAATKNLHETPL